MLDVSTPVRAELEFSVDGMTATGSGKSMVSLPWIGKNFGVVNFILGGAGLDKRKYPMQTEVACGLKEDVSIKMTGGFAGAVSMPSCPPVNDDCISYGKTFAYQDGTLDCSRELKLKVVEFSPKQYLTLKQTLKSTEYDERKVPVLAVAEGRGDRTGGKGGFRGGPAGRIRCEDFGKPQGTRADRRAQRRLSGALLQADSELRRQNQGGRGED